MKTTDKKQDFIRLRAEGKSYAAIAKELSISKSTCTAWAKDMGAQVEELRRERLRELYTVYGMAKEERIRQIGGALQKVKDALEEVDLREVAGDKLLKLQLEYTAALKAEYSEVEAPKLEDGSTTSILTAYADLLHRVQSGSVTDAQAKTEMAIIERMRQTQNLIDNDIFGSFNFGGYAADDEEEVETD